MTAAQIMTALIDGVSEFQTLILVLVAISIVFRMVYAVLHWFALATSVED